MSNNYWFIALNACFEWMLQFQNLDIRIFEGIWIVISEFEYYFRIRIFESNIRIFDYSPSLVHVFIAVAITVCRRRHISLLEWWGEWILCRICLIYGRTKLNMSTTRWKNLCVQRRNFQSTTLMSVISYSRRICYRDKVLYLLLIMLLNLTTHLTFKCHLKTNLLSSSCCP